MNRRNFIKRAALLSGACMAGLGKKSVWAREAPPRWRMPDEGEPHQQTWMAFGASKRIWGRRLLPEVQRNLALIANTISRYEPVSMLVREREMDRAQSLVDPAVTLVSCAVDDLWIRDTGPTFVINDQHELGAVDFNFNGWGEKQTFSNDAKVASFVARQVEAPILPTDLTLEGGCFEVDGKGTAILTESCVLNKNRNPGISKSQFEDMLMPLLGLQKIIWLPGIRGKDITDGHTDFYVRFAGPGVVLAGLNPDPTSYDHEVTLEHLDILKTATDAQGKKLTVEILEAPGSIRDTYANDEFAAGYIGYYLCNGAVIMQEFGDETSDNAAKDVIQGAFPERNIERLNLDAIAAGGGSIHCATQQQPRV